MSLLASVAARAFSLPPATTPRVHVERDVRLRACDGVVLLTDLYLSRPIAPRPVILIRTPYGRVGAWALFARGFAQRGYNVVIQSCRGTFGSGGEITFSAEAEDGRAAADWIVTQHWSNGVMGGCRSLPGWPPAASMRRWYLQPGGDLSEMAPVASEPERFRHDPANPTPAVGGTSLSSNSGPRDNRSLEARADVLTYTTSPLERDLEVIGPVCAELHLTSSTVHFDVFARLCDVEPSGRSINVCDGILRCGPATAQPIRVDLWPTAYRFARGHRVRLQLSGGAHPRFARNLGSGEPLATATRLAVSERTVYHDPERPSCLTLPMVV